MDDLEIDIEKLISLIRERPVLWDKSLDEYKSRYLTVDLWKEVCRELFDDFDSWNDKDKNECGKAVIKKWTNLKDSLIRSEKKRASVNTFSEGKIKVRKYIYHDQLSFLKKNWIPKSVEIDKPSETESWISFPTVEMENVGEIEESCPGSTYTEKSNSSNVDKSIRKRKFDEIYEDNFNTMESSDEHHSHFFKAILPTIRQLNEDETLKFQIGVMQLLRNIKKERVNSECCHHTVTSGGPSNSPAAVNSGQRKQSSSSQSENTVTKNFPGRTSSSFDLSRNVKKKECMDPTSPGSPVSAGSIDFTTNE